MIGGCKGRQLEVYDLTNRSADYHSLANLYRVRVNLVSDNVTFPLIAIRDLYLEER